LTPYQLLILGYALITTTGALLLSLPVSSTRGISQPFLDALFVATSGISTSGLSVVDIGSFYSLFGQIVLLVIFQIGGIGYMSFIILMMYVLGIKGSMRTSYVAKESLAGPNLHSLRRFFLSVLAYSLVFELVGAAILAARWMKEYPPAYALYLGTFHSVSTFCTAGFGLFPDSLMRYRDDTFINATIVILSLAGGIGFFVLRDLTAFVAGKIKRQGRPRLTVHTKLVLIVTTIVISFGAAVILLSEPWPATMSGYDRAMVSVFQSVSASTTDGFNTIDIGKMGAAGLTILMLLMFVGASPGSTGGGIKTTTFGLLFILLWARLRKKQNNALGREMSERCTYDAATVAFCFALVVLLDIVILSVTERTSYIQNLFEIVSALGNTGLSTGITAGLSPIGKAVLIATMFIGRVGVLSLAFAFLLKPAKLLFRYPAEDVFVG
jgi:trk system potassium uptake protein TrkH